MKNKPFKAPHPVAIPYSMKRNLWLSISFKIIFISYATVKQFGIYGFKEQ